MGLQKTVTNRRRNERMTALWYGRFKATRFAPWVECRLFDVSVAGAAMEVEDPPDCSGPIKVEVRCMRSALDRVRLRAVVRNRCPLPNGNWRVGIEFVGRSQLRRASLLRMIRQHDVSALSASSHHDPADR